jgi:hypothetical protein
VYLRDVLTGLLETVNTGGDFTSPRLGIRFVQKPEQELEIYHPNGEPFRSGVENAYLMEQMEQAQKQSEERRRGWPRNCGH